MEGDTPDISLNIQWAGTQQVSASVDFEINMPTPVLSFWNEAAPFASDDDLGYETWTIGRFTIVSIDENPDCKILNGRVHRAILMGSWMKCEYKVGMRVRVYDNLSDKSLSGVEVDAISDMPVLVDVSPCNNGKTYLIDDSHNGIVIEDDVLPVTCFCTALECINNPRMSRMVADISFEYSHPSTVLGKVIHEVMEECVTGKKYTFTFIVASAKKCINKYEKELYACNISDKMLLNDFLKHVKYILKFLESKMNIIATEKGVISKDLGLKGYIDCYGPGLVVEIKTGKTQQVSHRAQLLLYSLLVMDGGGCLDGRGNEGLKNLSTTGFIGNNQNTTDEGGNYTHKSMLYYVKTGEFVDINIKYAEVASLLQLRNRIAVSKEVVDCDCSELKPCRVYRKIQELPQSHFLRMQLDGIESEYLSNSKYHRAVVVERTDSMIGVKFVEDVPSGEYFALFSKRNKHITDGTVDRIDGKIVYIRLREYFVEEDVIYVCSDRCEIFYKYMRWSLINLAFPKYFQSQSPGALAGMHLPTENSEEPLTADCSVNSEGCSIFSGDDILKIERDCKDLSENDFLDEEFSSCRGIDREISFSGESLIKDFQSEENDHLEGTEVDSSMIDEISNLSSIELSSIEAPIGDNFKSSQISSVNINSKLMNSSSLEVRPKRQKVAFNHEDVPFLANASTDSLPFTASEESIKTQVSIPSLYKDEFGRLNEGQQAALIKALNCKYFNTVHGMPGTGKTTLISLLIKILAYYGKKILVICYTHMAIENIIKKIGSTPYYRANWPINEKEKFKESVASAKVVFGTCFCFGDPVFIQNKFNFCIIDEGSQMHLLLALIPISLSERVCVVGDHLQLKPLAKSNKEMGISIFNHLMEGCSVLRKQYRMNSGIMRLSNILFYNQQLVNGRNLKAVSNKPAVEFVDTDCTKLKDAVTALRPCTILCYFNSTVKEVKRMTNYVVTTIDRFQGSEDDRIAVVFDPVTPCCVMESRERLNVALTRARDYLCLIGSRSRMEEIEVLKELLNIL